MTIDAAALALRAAWDWRWTKARAASAPLGDRAEARTAVEQTRRRAAFLMAGVGVPADVEAWTRAVAAELTAGRRRFVRNAARAAGG